MKNILALFSLVFLCIPASFAQKLGHSAITPFGGSVEYNNHTFYSNSGESFDTRIDGAEQTIFEGLLHNISNEHFDEYYIQVRYFFDLDQDGRKGDDEVFMRIGAFTIEGVETYSNYEEQGVLLRAIEGEYTIEYSSIGTAEWELTNQANYIVTLNESNKSVEIEYGLYQEPRSAIDVKITSNPFRCLFPVDYRICVMNNGTIPETGTVWLQMDPRFSDIWYQWEPDHMIDSTFVGWDMTIQPGELIVYRYGIRAPGINSPEELGTLYYTNVNVDSEFGITTEDMTQALTCSYDPNDKLVSPNRPDSLGLLDKPIAYTIRFQNTGNAEAYNVVVTDTLSDDLDMKTFRMIDTSHPDELTVVFNEDNNHIVNFRFDNIFLPDSTTNLEGSNGFVMYLISLKEDTPINTEINNTGHIYFDFNPAIVTNTTSTTMVDTFPVIVGLEDLQVKEDFMIYPNPAKDWVNLEREVEQVNMYDIFGRKVMTVINTRKLDVRQFVSGTYLLELKTGASKFVEKLLITD